MMDLFYQSDLPKRRKNFHFLFKNIIFFLKIMCNIQIKRWKQVTKLSGGEKTLSSLALIFALH